MITNRLYVQISGISSAVLSVFLADSISQMLPWLVVMSALIVCDLIAGVCKAWKIGEVVSPSRAVRDTTAKACTYYSAVIFVCLFQAAAHTDTDYCLAISKLICVIEGASILGNILRWHGYYLDGKALLSMTLHRIFGGNREDYNGVIKKECEQKTEDENKI